MTLSIDIPQELEKRLKEEASRHGVALDEFAKRLLEEHLPPQDNDAQVAPNVDQILDEFFAANPEALPSLPTNFSRDDIYADHD
ncbi:MAG TPA: hypothetical protein VK797_03610 [Tepidisphaeraceae bacterium]|jgi:hypothetical protein|nr:hypothetical protein [Tepidisphaeraceae bacterium]